MGRLWQQLKYFFYKFNYGLLAHIIQIRSWIINCKIFDPKIHIRKIKKFYKYVKTYYEAQTKQMDVYSNIDNGYGIFAGYNLSKDSIVIQKWFETIV